MKPTPTTTTRPESALAACYKNTTTTTTTRSHCNAIHALAFVLADHAQAGGGHVDHRCTHARRAYAEEEEVDDDDDDAISNSHSNSLQMSTRASFEGYYCYFVKLVLAGVKADATVSY